MGVYVGLNSASKQRYWIDRHRYYELKHFCLQYTFWKKASESVRATSEKSTSFYKLRVNMLDNIAEETDPLLGRYVLKAATEDLSYDKLKVCTDLPCGKEIFYEAYRRFFWLLSEARQ